jgi:Fe-S-cluster containining protein
MWRPILAPSGPAIGVSSLRHITGYATLTLRDAEREPKIKELGSPTYAPPELTASGKRELEGYLLNTGKDNACAFLDQDTNLCSIHATRPLICRLFDCDGDGRQQLIDLGYLPGDRER